MSEKKFGFRRPFYPITKNLPSFWTEGIGSYVVAIVFALFIRWLFVEAYMIPSGSMLPSLLIRDHIFVSKLSYGIRFPFTEKWMVRFKDPKKGEIAVFKNPQNKRIFFVKRVVGEPGDKIFYENGDLYLNGELIEKNSPAPTNSSFDWLRDQDFQDSSLPYIENYGFWQERIGKYEFSVLLPKNTKYEGTYGPYTVPEGHFFVMGDNRLNSSDSRRWPADKRFVPKDLLVGKALFVWLSCEEPLPVVGVFCSPLSIRWKRFFHPVHNL